jgi:hemerythrin-like metal-binding protein
MPLEADFIPWGPELELGIPELDSQHRTLVGLANRLFASLKQEKQGEKAALAIAELFAYSATHFADEEAFFSQFNFPSLEKHSASHAAFVARASEFEERLASGSPADTAEILGFLQAWIKRHIALDDRELARIARQATSR